MNIYTEAQLSVIKQLRAMERDQKIQKLRDSFPRLGMSVDCVLAGDAGKLAGDYERGRIEVEDALLIIDTALLLDLIFPSQHEKMETELRFAHQRKLSPDGFPNQANGLLSAQSDPLDHLPHVRPIASQSRNNKPKDRTRGDTSSAPIIRKPTE